MLQKRVLCIVLALCMLSFTCFGCSSTSSKADEAVEVEETLLSTGICEVKDNRDGILTIISDDGDLETGMNLNSLATFYDLPITVAGVVRSIDPYLEEWKEIEEQGHIELISHSFTHYKIENDSDATDEILKREYIDALKYYEQNFSTPNYAMVFPNNCTVERSYDLLSNNDVVAVRQGERGLNSLRPEKGHEAGNWLNLKTIGIGDYKSVEEKNQLVDDAISNNQWLIEMWHNVTSNGGTYQEISTQTASALMAYDKAMEEHGDLWVANFTDAVAYLYEKENYTISAWGTEDGISAKITRTSDDWPYEKMNEKLTFFIVLPEDWQNATPAANQPKMEYEVRSEDGFNVFYFNAVPEADMTIKLIKA